MSESKKTKKPKCGTSRKHAAPVVIQPVEDPIASDRHVMALEAELKKVYSHNFVVCFNIGVTSVLTVLPDESKGRCTARAVCFVPCQSEVL